MSKKEELVRLSEYTPYPFQIPRIELDFFIYEKYVVLISTMEIEPLSKENIPMVLKGINLELDEIIIQGQVLTNDKYILSTKELIIKDLPVEPFKLKIRNRINPFENNSLEGLYLSESLLATQCEAEGFRRICFHPDRPDVLSKYLVRIEAEHKKFPLLLSNGNKIYSSNSTQDPSRHMVVWDDPFPKPSYLFALVAGNLERESDIFITRSGRKVVINLYVDEGDKLYCNHAIKSLKKAMRWDEDIYQLEYDLDEYNIVAVRHFNMGAMENKSLNIFNSKLVLADSEIATDDELRRIEGVIAHEYFHNWTGNRITCRDWFQLSLKEGLTVFRDQSFTADLHSESSKRIEDVSFLRSTQFIEDSGPTSHPVKPKEYLAIDNFYTTTIYEKGAEIIRMLYTILGHKPFIKGMNLYAKRFDGCAATTEDFIQSIVEGACVEKNNLNFDANQFSEWYNQKGTPHVVISREWESKTGKLILKVEQNNPKYKDKSSQTPLIIPLLMAVLTPDGRLNEETLFILDKHKKDFLIEDLPPGERVPTLSLFRRFSAPVTWKSDLSNEELFYLFKFDDDPFSRWDAGQKLMHKALLERASNTPDFELESNLVATFEYLIASVGEQDPEALSTLLNLPGLSELEIAQQPADPIGLYSSKIYLESLLGKKLRCQLRALLSKISASCALNWPNGQGVRKMITLSWRWLSLGGDVEIRGDLLQIVSGSSMTMTRAALNALQPVACQERELAMITFYNLWKDRPVILDAWFSLEASTPRKDSLQRVKELLFHPLFDPKAPNAVRAVLGGFSSNIKAFHSIDGSGYRFIVDQIIDLDQRNPITASKMAKVFCRWRSYSAVNRKAMYKALLTLSESELSSNTREVVQLILSE